MNITVKLFASLRKGRFDEKKMECAKGTTVGNICSQLEITENPLILFVNSKHVELNYNLSDGDELSIFPLVGGG
jgi:sulfur-carrier protein